MKIEIEIPESVINEAAIQAWKSCFRQPEYLNKSGREEVRKHLTTCRIADVKINQ
jgi:hypothetical protein